MSTLNQVSSVTRYLDKLVAKKANKPLTPAANELLILSRTAQSQHEEISDYNAPGECHDLVSKSCSREAENIAQRHGFLNLEILLKVIELRTSARFMYSNGLTDSF